MTGGVPRRREFREMIRKMGGLGIAVENGCAIEFIDGRFYRVLASRRNARAYTVVKRGRKVVSQEIRQRKQLTPITLLTDSRV
jgi:hypothetical protein